jgi:hypothetical protein
MAACHDPVFTNSGDNSFYFVASDFGNDLGSDFHVCMVHCFTPVGVALHIHWHESRSIASQSLPTFSTNFKERTFYAEKERKACDPDNS